MSEKYPGGFITKSPTVPTTTAAPGIWTLEQAMQYIKAGTWPLTYDPYFNYTTLLLPGNGTNGAQNNTFLDSSTNAFSITRNGNTTQGNFSPFSQTGWSNYFDGTGDYLTFAYNSAFSFGSGDFTIEGWWNITSLSSASHIITFAAASPASGSDIAFYIYMDGSANEAAVCNGGNYYIVTGWSSFVTLSQWQHFAFVRDGSTLRFYINGVQRGTAAGGVTINDNSGWTLKLATYTASTRPLNGYLSNIRLIKGTCQYPNGTTFTPSTTPLTAVSGTSLLTCQSNRFVDNSSNAFAVTVNGNTSVQAFSPFNPTAAWSAATNGGSGYFDGTGDYLSIANNTALQIGSSDMTLECWVYATVSHSGDNRIIGKNSGYSEYTLFWQSATQIRFVATTNGTSWTVDMMASSIQVNAWNHVAVTRSGSNWTLWINGVSAATATTSGTVTTNTSALTIGGDGTYNTTGYISNARLVKGTAVYTGAFTPPTAPLTAITNTSLLCNLTNAGIYDATAKNDLETVGNAQISTTQSKFGGSSMYFDGTGDYLKAPNNPNIIFGAGDFTIEGWFYIQNLGSVGSGYGPALFDVGQYGSSNYILVRCGDYYINGSGANWNYPTSTYLTGSTWTHIAVVRYGTSLKIYVNGSNVYSTTNSTSINTSGILTIAGSTGTASNEMQGYIQDFRITKGVARYTANFTAPTAPFALF